MKAAEQRPWTYPTLISFQNVSSSSLGDSLCGELTFKIKFICNFLVNYVINYICYEICCGIFFLQIVGGFVHGSLMFESLLLCISMVPF